MCTCVWRKLSAGQEAYSPGIVLHAQVDRAGASQLEAVPIGRATSNHWDNDYSSSDLFQSQANLPAFGHTEVPYIYDTYQGCLQFSS